MCMNLLLHLIYCNIKVSSFTLKRIIALAIIFLCNFSYAQKSEVDSLLLEVDTLAFIAPTTTLYVGENTKVFIKKGTVTKNLVENIAQHQIVYVEDSKEISYPIIENTPILLAEVKPKTRLEKYSKDITVLEEQLQKVKFNYYPPLTVLSSFSSVKIATTNSFEIYPKATINTKHIDNQLYSASYFYKKTYYYYINDCISYCISTLDIRSPSFIA